LTGDFSTKVPDPQPPPPWIRQPAPAQAPAARPVPGCAGFTGIRPVFYGCLDLGLGDEGMSELWRKSAVELAALIRDREVSSREVVQAHLDRVEAVNPHLNALVRLLPDEALAAADAADRAVADGAGLGPLHGVPFTVKENIDLAGTPTTQAVPALAEAVARIDAPRVQRLRAAGAIPFGRSNLPDFDIVSLDGAFATLELMRPVPPANLLGTPAAVVPAGMADGLPVGVQVMGGRFTELRCLAVAEAIEQRLGPLTPIDPVTG
jgi:Asp-tRNA(Asn)/Glu-tRNA(Gln) amidotransferase A subunit family amidase